MSNSSNGHNFEKEIESKLKNAKIQFVSQPRLIKTKKRLDIVLTESNGLINLSCKRSLRERYEQCAVETMLAREIIPNIKTIIITGDDRHQITLTKSKIEHSEFLQSCISNIIHLEDLNFLLTNYKFKKLPINILNTYFLSYSNTRSNL